MAKNITYMLRWTAEVCAVPMGAGPMSVPDQQRLRNNQASVSGGGPITISSTGDFPLAANIVTACTSMGTNAAASFNVAAVLAQIQAFNSGGG